MWRHIAPTPSALMPMSNDIHTKLTVTVVWVKA